MILSRFWGESMRRFVEEADRGQWTLLPECLDDFIDESNPVRVMDVFVDAIDLAEMSFPAKGFYNGQGQDRTSEASLQMKEAANCGGSFVYYCGLASTANARHLCDSPDMP